MEERKIIQDAPNVICNSDHDLCCEDGLCVGSADTEVTPCSDNGVIEAVVSEDSGFRQENVITGCGFLWIMLVVWLFFSYLDAEHTFHKDRGYIVMFVKFLLFFLTPLAVCIYIFREIYLM